MLGGTFVRLARMFPFLTESQPGHFLICVHAKPGARASAFAGPLTPHHTEVDLRIAAPPVEGQANAELIRFLDTVVEEGLRELRSNPVGYLAGTSYTQIVVADVAAASPLTTSGTSEGGGKKTKKQGKAKDSASGNSGRSAAAVEGDKPTLNAKATTAAALPDRVKISLVRGGTSREKMVMALFPGTRAQLAAILEKASQS
jgi:uncharacterized protein YggU (UPF0235/DUF167 family)